MRDLSEVLLGARRASLVFFHSRWGAGSQNGVARKCYLQEELAQLGVASFGFDHSGSGESSGDIATSSLKKRVDEARVAIETFGDSSQPITLVASSMGGYIAIRLLELYNVQNLILFCPAVYDHAAFNVPFGAGFTDIIRREHSWQQSDAGDILSRFCGNLLHVIGSEDDVIPSGVTEMIRAATTHVAHKQFLTLVGCDHKIHSWIPEHPADRESVEAEIFKRVA